jgi:type VI secretion system protein ImpF
LEELLNTRLGTVTFPPEFPEILRSPVAYGIPDFGSVPSSTTLQQETIGRVIEDTINRFEPRLREVRVNLQGESWGGTQMKVQFEIEARLSIDPYPDISFETIVELTTGCTSIRALKS